MGDFVPTEKKVNQKSSFSALTKDELSKIYEAEKWNVVQSVLFAGFAVAWIAIFINVVVIIAGVFKCKPEPSLMWYQDNVVYKIMVLEFGGDVNAYPKPIVGVKNHLQYIDDIKAKTILVSGLNNTTLSESQNDAFENLVEEIHHKKGRKIIVETVVHSLPVNDQKFIESASSVCRDDSSALHCDMFVWETRNATINSSEAGWVFDSTRNQSYKVVQGNPTQAMLNYGSNSTLQHVKNLLDFWLNLGVDGVFVRDISKLHSITEQELTKALWSNHYFADENNVTKALYISSSTPESSNSSASLLKNQSDTMHSPVFFSTDISRFVGEAGAGKMIEETIRKWRTETPFSNGFEISPVAGPPAFARFPRYAAGLILLSLALPGVAVLRSGDELLASSATFSWKAEVPDSLSMNGSEMFLKEIKRMVTYRVAGIRSKHSLRFDTKDQDTVCAFLDVGNADVLALKRKWTTRDSILVVSNMSPNDRTVSLIREGGLMNKESMVEKAKVLASSIPQSVEKGAVISLNSVLVRSGTTLVMEAE